MKRREAGEPYVWKIDPKLVTETISVLRKILRQNADAVDSASKSWIVNLPQMQ